MGMITNEYPSCNGKSYQNTCAKVSEKEVLADVS